MRTLVVFILLTIFSGSELRAMSIEQESQKAQSSKLIAHSNMNYDDSVSFHESQIRKADSLYKNYLPQSNFEEVKAAMEFFDSCQLSAISRQRWRFFDSYQQSAISRQRWRLFGKETDDENRLIAESRQLTAAKAHYYHAVGLTEKDDIVGACEHYLTALEIMEFETENLRTSKSESILANGKRLKSKGKGKEKAHGSQLIAHSSKKSVDRCLLTVDNPEDYEKIRFLALTYNRLGRLFYNENYCDLAILKYKKALSFVELIKYTAFKANVLKELGNVYHLNEKNDSALYYYKSSLKVNPDLTNKLDLEKNIAQILFEKGDKDSAYILIKNNLDLIENINVRYSYYNILGEMYMDDKEYDSAVYYLTKSINSNISDIKVNSAIKLSAIYDFIGDYEKKAYYDGIISKISINDVNKSLKNNKLQAVYDKYKERKAEKEKIKSRTRTKVIAKSLSLLIIISFVIIILIWHKSKRKDRLHQESLNEKDRYIANKEEIISRTNEEIKRKESVIKELVEIIGNLKSDINSLKDDAAIKEEEISCKETDIKKMENDLSAKERELKRLQENVHENRILIDRLNEDNIAKEKQIECYLEEIDDNRQVINDKNHLISIATEELVARKDAIAENRNEIARLQAIIGKNEKVLNELSEDYRNNKEQMAVYLDEIEKLKTEINQAQIDIKDLRFKNSFTEGKIKKQNAELKNKEELINKYKLEINDLKDRFKKNHINISNLNCYLQSEICAKILNEIKELSENNKNNSELTTMSQKELVLLLNSANFYLNNLMNYIVNKYPKLKKSDLYYLCLVIIGLNNSQISSLFGVTHTAARKRKNKICKLLGLNINENLHNYLLRLL